MTPRRGEVAPDLLAETLHQRCFWLSVALALLIVSVPFLEGTATGRIALHFASLLVLIAGAAAISRSAGAVIITALLALPTAVFVFLSLAYGQTQLLVLSQGFGAAFYVAVTRYLLSYTLQRDVMTIDKLYGAAAAFLLLGVVWSYLYAILLAFYPGALVINGSPVDALPPSSALYFSFAVLTAVGMSDILPMHPVARMLCSLEMITGVLFIAVLIARLAGTYPPRESKLR